MEIHPYISELVGTAILLLLGNGVVANVSLNKLKNLTKQKYSNLSQTLNPFFGNIDLLFIHSLPVYINLYSIFTYKL